MHISLNFNLIQTNALSLIITYYFLISFLVSLTNLPPWHF
jgi:hypothetical protein